MFFNTKTRSEYVTSFFLFFFQIAELQTNVKLEFASVIDQQMIYLMHS